MTDIPVAAALLTVAAATLLAIAVRRSLFHWTSVTSESMLPTLRPGDRRLTLRSRGLGGVRRGDVVVVRSRELGTDVVKRVIGLPGDHVRIDPDGTVEVNGATLTEPYVVFPGGPGGRFHVPAGSILLLGDNRAASSDSRRWRDPYLPEEALRGRLVRTGRLRQETWRPADARPSRRSSQVLAGPPTRAAGAVPSWSWTRALRSASSWPPAGPGSLPIRPACPPTARPAA